MTTPPQPILVKCPQCGVKYKDWYRPSLNLMLENFSEEYIREATTSTCPECNFTVRHNSLVVDPDGTFISNNDPEEDF